MNKTKILIIGVVILVVLNVGLMAIILLNKPPHHQPPHLAKRIEPKHIIIERLQLDTEQVSDYESLIQKHREQIHEQEEKIRIAKQGLFNLLQYDDYSQKDSIINYISDTQKMIENIHFSHFNDIKNLCTENQMNEFNNLSKELTHLFSPHPPKR